MWAPSLVVSGPVYISSVNVFSMELDSLEHVRGGDFLYGADFDSRQGRFHAPRLARVDGEISLRVGVGGYDPVVAPLDVLEYVGALAIINVGANFDKLALPSLTTINGRFTVSGPVSVAGDLGDLRMLNLTRIVGDVSVSRYDFGVVQVSSALVLGNSAITTLFNIYCKHVPPARARGPLRRAP